MKLYTTALIVLLFLFGDSVYAQSEYLHWNPLIINESQRIWYDESSLDTLHFEKFNIWILQMHKTPLQFEEIPGKIYRTKIQYAVDLNADKYGILKVVYYGINNKEIYNFDYHIDSYPDSIKYTYPISDNSFMKLLIGKIKKSDNKEPSITQ